MVDFSFIVSLYVSDLPNVTISTIGDVALRRARVSNNKINFDRQKAYEYESEVRQGEQFL